MTSRRSPLDEEGVLLRFSSPIDESDATSQAKGKDVRWSTDDQHIIHLFESFLGPKMSTPLLKSTVYKRHILYLLCGISIDFREKEQIID